MAVSCSGFIEPLNLECLLINVFAGSLDLFLFISFIALAITMAKFKMRNETALLLFSIYAFTMSSYMPWLTVLIILLGGFIIFFSMKSLFSRN